MRVRLPQRHGALGAVATLLGHAGANISRLQVRGKDERGAVVDFLLDAPDDPDGDPLVDLAVEELDRLADVVVEEVTHYPAGGGLHYDLEVIERMRSGTGDPARVLATAAPLLCQAEWAAVIDVPRLHGRVPDLAGARAGSRRAGPPGPVRQHPRRRAGRAVRRAGSRSRPSRCRPPAPW